MEALQKKTVPRDSPVLLWFWFSPMWWEPQEAPKLALGFTKLQSRFESSGAPTRPMTRMCLAWGPSPCRPDKDCSVMRHVRDI